MVSRVMLQQTTSTQLSRLPKVEDTASLELQKDWMINLEINAGPKKSPMHVDECNYKWEWGEDIEIDFA